MIANASVLLTLGGLLLIGLATYYVGRYTFVPRVSALLAAGILFGPAGVDWLPDLSGKWFPYVADMTLVLVGFMLGSSLNRKSLQRHGRCVLSLSMGVALVTPIFVSLGLMLIGVPLPLALLFGGIATATDPAATRDVVEEVRADGNFSKTLLGIVAVDDAWGLIVFSLMLAAAQVFTGASGVTEIMAKGAWEILGAVALGVGLGVPMSYLTGRIQPGEPTLVEALGMVFLCGGIALILHVSYLLAAMSMGATVSNLARHHTRPFHAIENLEWVLLVLFFILTGASLRFSFSFHLILIVVVYVGTRIVGRLAGALGGGLFCRAGRDFLLCIGASLLPHAGVALGMALLASVYYPEETVLLQVVVTATVIFEIVGPLLTRLSLKTMGETKDREP